MYIYLMYLSLACIAWQGIVYFCVCDCISVCLKNIFIIKIIKLIFFSILILF